MASSCSVRLVVSGEADVDGEELEALTSQLRGRLLELDVDDVRRARSGDPVPEGAKPGELITVGALAVGLAPVLLRPALRLVETWMQNRPVRSVKVEMDGSVIELGHTSAEQQERLITAFLEGTRSTTGEEPASGGTGEPAGTQG